MRVKAVFREVNGILLLDKNTGISSNKILQQIKFLYQAQKAGHTGSLDPLASGMLPICFGEATKFSQFLLDSDKRYFVKAQLGVKTSTGDAEGEIIAEKPVPRLQIQDIENLLTQFTGKIQQIPSMYSALKHQGQPLYRLARKGLTVERETREITIHQMNLIDWQGAQLSFEVHCSKGTYIRNLVEDMGEALGCGAYVTQLHRLAVSGFTEEKMLSFDKLLRVEQSQGLEGLDSYLLPVETCVASLPKLFLQEMDAKRLLQGQKFMVSHSLKRGSLVSLKSISEVFLGIGTVLEDGCITAKRLLKQS